MKVIIDSAEKIAALAAQQYVDLLKRTPKVGAIVKTPEGKGVVTESNLLSQRKPSFQAMNY